MSTFGAVIADRHCLLASGTDDHTVGNRGRDFRAALGAEFSTLGESYTAFGALTDRSVRRGGIIRGCLRTRLRILSRVEENDPVDN